MSNHRRILLFIVFLAIGGIVFGRPAMGLFLSHSELYSHIPAVYLIIGYLVFKDRKNILSDQHSSVLAGIPTIIAAGSVYAHGIINHPASQNDFYSIVFLSIALYITGIALCFLGMTACRKAGFAIFMLLFTIPIPDVILSAVVSYLRIVSTLSTVWVLETLNFFPIREGFVLKLPQVSVEVAEQCSGIRSSIAVVIVSLLYGHFFLRTYASKAVLVLFGLFMAPFKNGLRIATLMILSIYWDKRILAGSLHTSGGIPFFLLALVVLSLVMLLLIKIEKAVLRRFGSSPKEAGSHIGQIPPAKPGA